MPGRWKKRLPVAALALASLLAIASIASAPRPSPEPGAGFLSGARIDPGVLAIFRRSCADCHSNETRYPWYSYIAPVSFLVRSDVEEGRRHLNFSRWSDYSFVRRTRCLSEIANQVRDGEMPLRVYTLIHRNAKLSQSDVNAIFAWTQAERARLIESALQQ